MQTADTCISCQEGWVEQLLPHQGQGGAYERAGPTREEGASKSATQVWACRPPLCVHTIAGGHRTSVASSPPISLLGGSQCTLLVSPRGCRIQDTSDQLISQYTLVSPRGGMPHPGRIAVSRGCARQPPVRGTAGCTLGRELRQPTYREREGGM